MSRFFPPRTVFNSQVAISWTEKKRANMGSVEMRNNLRFAPDMGTDLVERNSGYVGVLQNYVNAKPVDRKKYVNFLAHVLAEQISRTEIHSDCTCKLRDGLHPETECSAKETKLLEPVSISDDNLTLPLVCTCVVACDCHEYLHGLRPLHCRRVMPPYGGDGTQG